MSTRLYVVCDGCGTKSAEWKNGGMKIGTLRGELRLAGWETLDARQLDYCPPCRKKREAVKRKT